MDSTPQDKDAQRLPTRVGQKDPSRIVVEWADGRSADIRTAELRRACPCARCVHELTGEPILDPASVPEDLQHGGASFVGRYALQVAFNDGHNTGIYTWSLLLALADAGGTASGLLKG